MNINFEAETKTKSWKVAFEFIWAISLSVYLIYSYLIWSHYSVGNSIDDYVATIAIIIIFGVCLYGMRWRFYQMLNMRIFAMSITACVYLIALLLREASVISSDWLEISTIVFVIMNILFITS